jgi:hypothetical protein
VYVTEGVKDPVLTVTPEALAVRSESVL